jgi:hypothetical protein
MSGETRITHAPERIYLNLGDDLPVGETEFGKLSAITWCVERMGSDDLVYVREDTLRAAGSSDIARHKRRATSEFLSRTGLAPTPRTMEALHATLDLFLAHVRGEGSATTPVAGFAPSQTTTAR